MLRPDFTPRFKKDMKRLARRRVDEAPLREVMELIVQDAPESARELARRHGAHPLRGEWQGSFECHIANAGTGC